MKKLIIFVLVLALALGGCSGPAGSEGASTGSGGESSRGERSDTASEISQASESSSSGNEAGSALFECESEIVALEGEYDFRTKYSIETGGTIVFCGDYGELTLFDAASGERLYETQVGGGYVIRLDEYTDKTGYDYRLVMEDRVVYRSTSDHEKELAELLPNGMFFDHDSFPCEVKNAYDINEDSFVWAAEEGIMLADKDGNNSKLVLNNADLTEISKLITNVELEFVYEYGFSFLYQNPRFILNGTKLVAGIISQEGIYYGIVVYNIAADEIETAHGFYEPEMPIYPVNDRYAVSRASRDFSIVDCLTSEIEYNKRIYSGQTSDYKTVILCEYGFDNSDDLLDYRNLHAYICDIDNLSDKSTPFVFVIDPYMEAILTVISNDYAIISTKNSMYAVKYSL